MRVKAIGVQRMSGVGKDSGMPYDFAQLLFLAPIQSVSSEKFKLQGIGYEVSKLDLQVDALHKFNDIKFPADLDLALEQIPDRRGVKTVCVGFSAQQVKAVA